MAEVALLNVLRIGFPASLLWGRVPVVRAEGRELAADREGSRELAADREGSRELAAGVEGLRGQGAGREAAKHTDPWLSQGAWLSASCFLPFC